MKIRQMILIAGITLAIGCPYLSYAENNFTPGYCTYYAAERFNEASSVDVYWNGDAGKWIDNAKLKAEEKGVMITSNPREITENSILVWSGNKFNPKGHVAIVDRIDFDQKIIYYSEMNYKQLFDYHSGKISFENMNYGKNLKFAGAIIPVMEKSPSQMIEEALNAISSPENVDENSRYDENVVNHLKEEIFSKYPQLKSSRYVVLFGQEAYDSASYKGSDWHLGDEEKLPVVITDLKMNKTIIGTYASGVFYAR